MKIKILIYLFLTMLIISSCNERGNMIVNNKEYVEDNIISPTEDDNIEDKIEDPTDDNDFKNGQEVPIDDSPWPFYDYESLSISVQDAYGNDLIKKIGSDWWRPEDNPGPVFSVYIANSALYTLELVYPDPKMNPFYYLQEEIELINGLPRVIHTETGPLLSIFTDKYHLNEDNHYLFFLFSSNKYYGEPLPPAKKIIIKLNCPILFGDNKDYEIVTYWEQWMMDGIPYLFKCMKIEFDGEEIDFQRIPVIPTDERYGRSYATIILKEQP